MVEEVGAAVAAPSAAILRQPRAQPQAITAIDPIGAAPQSTGVGELDRVLSGGLVAGSVTLLGGEPGMGKSTLALQALAGLARRGVRCLLVAAEESVDQVRARAGRIDALADELVVVAANSLPEVLAHADAVQPAVLAVDSIQTISDPELGGVPGSVTQVRDCAQALVRLAKTRDIAVVLIGHVTKEGTLAGPRVLEHVVDTVLAFDGDRHHSLRMVHALKHRFGSALEVGLFEMGEAGLRGVEDPSALFLADRREGASGSVVCPVLDGARPLLVEVQALVAPASVPAQARRSVQGFESGRLAMLLAVLERHTGLRVAGCDVFVSVAGGVRVSEPAGDLAVALAVASALLGKPIVGPTVVVGEIGLGGELRGIGRLEQRLSEAARLGLHRAIVPQSAPVVPGVTLERVHNIASALRAAGLLHGSDEF